MGPVGEDGRPAFEVLIHQVRGGLTQVGGGLKHFKGGIEEVYGSVEQLYQGVMDVRGALSRYIRATKVAGPEEAKRS